MSNLLVWRGPTNGLLLTPESPKLQYTDRVRATDVYMGVQAVAAANMLSRGTFGSGFRYGWVVNQCTMDTMKGGIGKLTIEWEAGGAGASQPLPVGTALLKPQEMYPKIERNSYFKGTSGVAGAPTTPIVFETIQLAYNALYNSQQTGSSGANMAGNNLTGDQLLYYQKLFKKLQQGEETYYLAGWRYTYEVYSYDAPVPFRGAIVQTPGGPLAGTLPPNIGWVRLADDLDPAGVAGSMWKLTVTYLGGPQGYWDTDIYNGN
jgi:hypothetical protein